MEGVRERREQMYGLVFGAVQWLLQEIPIPCNRIKLRHQQALSKITTQRFN